MRFRRKPRPCQHIWTDWERISAPPRHTIVRRCVSCDKPDWFDFVEEFDTTPILPEREDT